MDEYGINLKGDLAADVDNTYDIGSSSKRIKTIYSNEIDNLGGVGFIDSTAPVSTEPGLQWFNTANNILQIRNAGDTAWLGVMYGDSNNKIWMYSNIASDGWVIDGTVADVNIAIKGGSDAYNVNGGNLAGTWTQPDHTLIVGEIPSHDHGTNTGSDGEHTHGTTILRFSKYGSNGLHSFGGGTEIITDGANPLNHTHSIDAEGGDGTHNHGATFRPAAAVGTLQYPNI